MAVAKATDSHHHMGDFDAQAVVVTLCISLSIYNALELLLLVFTTFKRWTGLYFYSLLAAGWAILPYSLGYMIDYFGLAAPYSGLILSQVGWVMMVTGQSVVLYSRLHLVLKDQRILTAVKWMIIIDAVIFHTITIIVHVGSDYGDATTGFGNAYKVVEKIQMTVFCIQEFIISGLYVRETARLLKVVSHHAQRTRNTMWQLFSINVFIIIMDIGLLAVEYRGLLVYEQCFKGLIYSIKLKLEFAILGKLVGIVDRPDRSSTIHDKTSLEIPRSKKEACVEEDISDYVDTSRTLSDVTHASSTGPRRKRSSRNPKWGQYGIEDMEVSSEHVENSIPENEDIIRPAPLQRHRALSNDMYANAVKQISR